MQLFLCLSLLLHGLPNFSLFGTIRPCRQRRNRKLNASRHSSWTSASFLRARRRTKTRARDHCLYRVVCSGTSFQMSGVQRDGGDKYDVVVKLIIISLCSPRTSAARCGAPWDQPATQSWTGLLMGPVVARTRWVFQSMSVKGPRRGHCDKIDDCFIDNHLCLIVFVF